ncbi:LacI family DNA-binding transcriptional regulator [Zhihengliuella halotolerans]|uniref:DNA-binding LacI/PurR family transcriptional regulator n=1 Tax=Zhihengliuella halotolerans TaxID=370736 RepID=A0A4Q8AGU8_9MICC|nr:LacI family DNA-binding transcriptional regulator [Zhihengliuella halotolerans]RZU62889.1 DNA-binding LacI/PurR family transcriptional regulator [Zhihengliuella halotolerans]
MTSITNRTPSMRDVALAAGVSAQTVSRVLSDSTHVQPETKSRVLAAVEELGYRRNKTARALVTGQSKTLGLITLATNFYSRSSLAMGIENEARANGYIVNATTTESLGSRAIAGAISRLVDQGVDGLIIAVPLRDVDAPLERLTRRLPTVTVDGLRTSAADIVAVDQVSAARVATQHLLDLGHQTVWHVAGPVEWSDSDARIEGWQQTLRAAGASVPPELHGDWTPESGYRNGLILGRMPDVTAILVASDEMAFGLLRAFTELGRRVPDDVSVVGFDDIALAAYASPPLTTVRQSFEETGCRAVRHLLRHISDPETDHVPELVEPELIIRSTTGPPPHA